MLAARTLLVIFLGLLCLPEINCQAQVEQFTSVRLLNAKLEGHVDDFTRNHGRFKRLGSEVLDSRKDLYVYTPPGYCPEKRYPLVLWLHGAFGDEHAFIDNTQLLHIDDEILSGNLPPMVIACPDGTLSGRNFLLSKHSFFVNGQHGRFRDFLLQEVLPFVVEHYAIDSCRRKHAIIGVSAGGLGGMGLALRCHDYFGAVATIGGALNLRYYNTHDDYSRDFEPHTFRMRSTWSPREVIGEIGPVAIKAGPFIKPVFGNDPQTIERIRAENPADVLCRCDLPPGKLNMLVAYGCQDEFNFDAQAESFIWLAQRRGLQVDVLQDAIGKHNSHFFIPTQRKALKWLAHQFRFDCESRKPPQLAKN